ncbi:FtsX-like permease family protein [Glycomyces tritici]|uniref:ABC3 transporter permease C-terminal domain-containing protein n=1 Tax=Glycomyces tritici TaxID=2665176 RepID=A0ABT7YJ08_9ACTN|nr:FtsX-like permease family protein [Glycomyces tritici]MDN3238617.1 hypothetical protein [Glycomyces tritici]
MGRLLASQRLAFRIARREALRYKGRSALSITLLGLPLLAVAIGASAYDTMMLSDEETVQQYVGENDAFIEDTGSGTPIVQHSWNEQWPMYEAEDYIEGAAGPTESEILGALPIGSWIVPYSTYEGSETIQVQTPDGLGSISTYGYDLHDGLYEKAGIEFIEGSAPGKGEVVLSEEAAKHLELGVGDMLVADQTVGTQEAEVSGIVEVPWNIDEQFVIGSMFATPVGGWLVDTPEELTYEDALALNELGVVVWAGSLIDRPTSGDYYFDSMLLDEATIMITGLIVVAVVMEVILLAGPAFAISARRRTREFALMSANGATPAQIRRVVLASGVIFGLIAAVCAIAIGILVVFAGMPILEGIFGYRSAGLRVLPLLQIGLVAVALTTGLLAALAAAISASRVNVVAALMGRTPGRKGSKRWLVIGLLMLGAGVASALAGVSMWSLPLMSAAIILAQLGLVACTPALLAVMAKLGRWLPLAPRMALREAGRNRGSAAPAIAAVLGVVAAGMVFSMIVTADAERKMQSQVIDLQQGTVTLNLWDIGTADPEQAVEPDWEAGLAEARTVLERHLDDLEIVPISMSSSWTGCTLPVVEEFKETAECSWMVTRPEENQCSYWDVPEGDRTEEAEREGAEAARQDPNCNETSNDVGISSGDTPTTTDPQIVAAYTGFEGEQLDEAVAVLEGGGVLVADPLALTGEGTVVLEGRITNFDEESGEYQEYETQYLELPAMAVDDSLLGYNKLLLSPGAAEQMGQGPNPYDRTYLLQTSTPVEGAVVEAISADLEAIGTGRLAAHTSVADYTDEFTFYMVLLVSGLCALVALGATAVSTGLIIAEQRKDMTTLGAVGAAPGLRKRFAMWQTVMIAVFGAGLGTIAGVIGYAMVQQALNRPLRFVYPFEVPYGWELPWGAMAVILVAVPVLAALGALVFTKAKLPSERRLT